MKQGADLYLTKPLVPMKLLKAVAGFIAKHLLLRYEREERRQLRKAAVMMNSKPVPALPRSGTNGEKMEEALQKDWEKCIDFHGHQCPGLAIGFRVAFAARKRLEITSAADEELVCVTENDACGIDAIQFLLSCTLGKGNLIYRDRGKQAFSFFLREQGKKLRIRLIRPFNKETGDRNAYQQEILTLPDEEIFSFSEPAYDLPVKARIFKTVTCEQCGETTAEAKIRLHDGKKLCLDCTPEYLRRW